MADPYAAPQDLGTTASHPTAPAHHQPGPFWTLAAIGIGLLVLARLLLLFMSLEDMDGEFVVAALADGLGLAALAIGLALAAVRQPGFSMGIRTALLLGAGFFATAGNPFVVLSGVSRLFG